MTRNDIKRLLADASSAAQNGEALWRAGFDAHESLSLAELERAEPELTCSLVKPKRRSRR